MPASRNDTGQLRRKLSEETRSLQELTTNIANQQYTKEGLSANSIVTEWLAAVLLAEKSRAELAVMKLRKQELDQKYTQFSPVGSTLKRKGRESTSRNSLTSRSSRRSIRPACARRTCR